MAKEVRIELTPAQKAKIKAATGKSMGEIRVSTLGKNLAVTPVQSTGRMSGQDTARVDQDSARVDQDSARVDQDTARVDQDSARVDQDSARVDQDTARVDQDSARVSED